MDSNRGTTVDRVVKKGLSEKVIPDQDWNEMRIEPWEHLREEWSRKRDPPRAEACLGSSKEQQGDQWGWSIRNTRKSGSQRQITWCRALWVRLPPYIWLSATCTHGFTPCALWHSGCPSPSLPIWQTSVHFSNLTGCPSSGKASGHPQANWS